VRGGCSSGCGVVVKNSGTVLDICKYRWRKKKKKKKKGKKTTKKKKKKKLKKKKKREMYA